MEAGKGSGGTGITYGTWRAMGFEAQREYWNNATDAEKADMIAVGWVRQPHPGIEFGQRMGKPDQVHEALEKLDRLTKANLHQEYENLKDSCEASINWANRCDMKLALAEMVTAASAGKRLREEAVLRFEDGYITKDEFADIVDESARLIHGHLPDNLTDALVKTCECKRGTVK